MYVYASNRKNIKKIRDQRNLSFSDIRSMMFQELSKEIVYSNFDLVLKENWLFNYITCCA